MGGAAPKLYRNGEAKEMETKQALAAKSFFTSRSANPGTPFSFRRVAKSTFDNGATLGNSPNTLERVYVNGRSIDEPLLVAIDGDSDEFLNTSKNTTNGVNLVDAEYYYLSNRLGSISAILDADNQDRILEYYRYEVFGSATVLPIVDNNTDGLEDTPLDLNDNNASGATLVSSFGNTYLYTARRFDDVTGLYYYRNRYYDPRSGRFITRDPQETPWYSLYSYCHNGTTWCTDPSGLGYPEGYGGEGEPGVIGPNPQPYGGPSEIPYGPRCDGCEIDLHTALDLAGLLPGIGAFFDAANMILYIKDEDYANAGIAAGSLIPLVGQGCTGLKFGIKLMSEAPDAIRAGKILKAAGGLAEAAKKVTKGATKGSAKLDDLSKRALENKKKFKPLLDLLETHGKKKKGSGRAKNKLKPDPKATGPHSRFKRDPKTGRVTGYETYDPNPKNPGGFDSKKRVDTQHGKPHSHGGVSTPHVHEGKKVRPAKANELPE